MVAQVRAQLPLLMFCSLSQKVNYLRTLSYRGETQSTTRLGDCYISCWSSTFSVVLAATSPKRRSGAVWMVSVDNNPNNNLKRKEKGQRASRHGSDNMQACVVYDDLLVSLQRQRGVPTHWPVVPTRRLSVYFLPPCGGLLFGSAAAALPTFAKMPIHSFMGLVEILQSMGMVGMILVPIRSYEHNSETIFL